MKSANKRVIQPEMVDNLPKVFEIYKRQGIFKPRFNDETFPEWAKGCHPEIFQITARLIVKECMTPVDGSNTEYRRARLYEDHFISIVREKFDLYEFALYAKLGLSRHKKGAIRKIGPNDFESSKRGQEFRAWFVQNFRQCFERIYQKLYFSGSSILTSSEQRC